MCKNYVNISVRTSLVASNTNTLGSGVKTNLICAQNYVEVPFTLLSVQSKDGRKGHSFKPDDTVSMLLRFVDDNW